MSLDWDLTNINNHDQLCWLPTGRKKKNGEDEFELNPVTNALIWLTMMVDFVPKTPKDAKEFFVRVRQWESAHEPMLRVSETYWAVSDGTRFDIFADEDAAKEKVKNGKGLTLLEGTRSVDRPITWEDVEAHTGLKTNVFPESKAKFKNKVMRVLREHAERDLVREGEELEEKQKTNIDRLAEAVHDHVD